MYKYNRYLTALLALVMIISILAGCGGASPTTTPTIAPTAVPLTATAVAAQPAATASAAMSVSSTLSTGNNGSEVAGLVKQAAANNQAAKSYHLDFTYSAGGQQAVVSMDLDVANNARFIKAQTVGKSAQIIAVGGNYYNSTDEGQTWSQANAASDTFSNMVTQISSSVRSLPDSAQYATGDPASETVASVEAKHIVVTTGSSTVELWISGSDQPMLVQYKSSDSAHAVTVNWSKFNEPVSITAPTRVQGAAGDATPATSADGGAATPTAEMAMTDTLSSENAAATPTIAMAMSPSGAIPYGTPGTIADTGFRPEANGYSFQNFGNQYPTTPGTFTVDEARKLLGDKAICARVDGDTCTPSAAAQQWIDQENKEINGGHCEGFAVSSMQLYKGIVKVSDLGSDSVNKLQLDPNDPSSNPALLDLIAGDWVLQTLNPVESSREVSFNLTPNQVLDTIVASMQNGAPDPLTLGFWKPGFKEGHAVVPIWVEDKGDGIVWLHIYDNNYPNEDRYIIFDRNAQTWTYSTTADPRQDASAYLGDGSTHTLALTPLSLRSQTPVCPFCQTASGSGLLAPSGQQQEQVMVDGNAALLFTDKDSHQFGYKGGKFVSDISGATQTLLPGGLGHDHSPIYNLPEGVDFRATLEGDVLTSTEGEEIAIFGQGEAVDIAGVKLDKGQSDSLSISGNGHKISYKPGAAETPEVKIANEDGAKDYGFDLTGIDFSAGEEVDFSVDDATGKLAIKDTTGEPDKYTIAFTETDASGTHKYEHKDVTLNPGDTEYLDFGDWQGGQPVKVEIDAGSNGSIDQTISESDDQP